MMNELEDFIEVDDDDLFMGDQHLKISMDPPKEEKKEVKVNEVKVTTKVDEKDLIDTDAYFNTQDEDDDEPEVKPKDTEKEVEKGEKFDDKPNENLNEFSIFGSSLSEKGFFPDLDDEELNTIEDEDDLSDKLAKQLNITFGKWQDSYKQNLVNNLIREGYISKEEVTDKISATYSPEEIKSDIDVAKKVIRNYYKRMGTPPKEIERIINSREDLEESALELNALTADLDKKEQQTIAAKFKQQEELAAQQREQFNEELKRNTFEFQEFIPGRKLKRQDKEEVFMNIEPTLKKINTNLAKYAPLLSYLDRYGILDGKFDKILKEGKTQSVSELQRVLTERKKGNSINPQVVRHGVINIDDSDVPRIYR